MKSEIEMQMAAWFVYIAIALACLVSAVAVLGDHTVHLYAAGDRGGEHQDYVGALCFCSLCAVAIASLICSATVLRAPPVREEGR